MFVDTAENKDKKTVFESVSLKMDYYPFDLNRIITDPYIRLPDTEILFLARQTALAVQYLHANFIVHRDLKPGNFLLNEKAEVALTDFGLSRNFGSPGRALTENVVTLNYRPPELLFMARFYSEKVDVWSLGCIFAEMFLKRMLFRGESDGEVLTQIFAIRGTPNSKNWPDAPNLPGYKEFEKVAKVYPLHELVKCSNKEVGALMERMLSLDPKSRPTLDEIVADPCLNTPQVKSAQGLLAEKLRALT